MAKFVKLYNNLFDYNLSGNELKLYLCLKHYSYADGTAVIKADAICGFCHFTKGTMYRALGKLEQVGLVRKSNRYAQGQYIANHYEITKLSGGWSKLPLSSFSIKGSEFATYAYLCRCQRFGNRAWVSYTAIAAALHISRTTAIEAVKALAAAGRLLKAAIRPGAHNLYLIIQTALKRICGGAAPKYAAHHAAKKETVLRTPVVRQGLMQRTVSCFIRAGRDLVLWLEKVVQFLYNKP